MLVQRNLGYEKKNDPVGPYYTDPDGPYYVVNTADPRDKDSAGDDLSDQPEATLELRAATISSILRTIQNPRNAVVKISMVGAARPKVRGYATFAHFLDGATLQQLETMLGYRSGVLQNGCNVYYLEPHDIKADNIGPRYLTSWSAGVSPRDLHNLSKQAGKPVGYHPNYPAASDPIFQFVIFRAEVGYRDLKVLQPGERFGEY